MRDGGIVAGIVADDPGAMAAAYDHYAPALYGYCWSQLTDPAHVAGAVRDTFLVAGARLPGLRDPGRLRPWLYAVARNECRRRRPYDPVSAGAGPRLGTGEGAATSGLTSDQAELRELVWSALASLDPADREIVELSLRHEFYGADLADVLGVPRNQVLALMTRARDEFGTALGALMVTRPGLRSCPALAGILGSGDEEPSPALRREVRRHITGCASCGQQWRSDLGPTALLSLLPVPVLPASLRRRVLGMLADGSRDAARERAEVAERAEPFTRSGFPEPLDPLAAVRGRPPSYPPPEYWSRCSPCSGAGPWSRRPPCIMRRPPSRRRWLPPSPPWRRPRPPARQRPPRRGPGAGLPGTRRGGSAGLPCPGRGRPGRTPHG